jgi:hypothetical protein
VDIPDDLDVETGYRPGEDVVWCVRWSRAPRTLCDRGSTYNGRAGSWLVPMLGPSDPALACPVCLAVLRDLIAHPVQTPPSGPSGVCPVCGQVKAVQGGRLVAHGICPGAGMEAAS